MAQFSDVNDQRIVAMGINGATPSGVPQASATLVNFNATPQIDTHGGYSAGIYTIPISGVYRVEAHIENDYTPAANVGCSLYIDNNGAAIQIATTSTSSGTQGRIGCSASAVYSFNAGDQVRIRYQQSGTATVFLGGVNSFLVTRAANPQQISATETVACNIGKGTSQNIPNTNSDTEITVYDTLNFDTHGAFSLTSGRYTCPVSGFYRVTGSVWFNSASGGRRKCSVWKNGAVFQYGVQQPSVPSGSECGVIVNSLVKCIAGDTLSMAAAQDSGTNPQTTTADSRQVFITIQRIGI